MFHYYQAATTALACCTVVSVALVILIVISVIKCFTRLISAGHSSLHTFARFR